jgi:hypothetical protein
VDIPRVPSLLNVRPSELQETPKAELYKEVLRKRAFSAASMDGPSFRLSSDEDDDSASTTAAAPATYNSWSAEEESHRGKRLRGHRKAPAKKRYDVDIVVRLVVYTGVGWIAVEGVPILGCLSGLVPC